MNDREFQVSLPSDEDGFIGRACSSSECNKYFKVFVSDHREELYCPYCGDQFHKNDLFTKEQMEHLDEVVAEEALDMVTKELDAMFSQAFRGNDNVEFRSTRHRKRTVEAAYSEREVDSQLACPSCKTQFQVYGIFGYCPGCRCENLLIYDANWNIVRQEVTTSANPQRALRHAYEDLVSVFESFCRKKAEKVTAETTNFQDLYGARRFFKHHASVDILDAVPTAVMLDVRRVFQKRHVWVHNGGTIGDRYVQKVSEDTALLGQQAELTLDELESGANAIRSILLRLVESIEAPG